MTEFPIPAYELAEVKKYFLGSIQYSSGCPYQCEFCDIPGLYGRNPRLKSPQQIIAELDKLRECGVTGSVYFVDDNFIGNRKAALDLLPHLVEWQKRTGYVMRLACEATLNIAKRPEILEKMREAFFVTVFCGIETPDPDALKAMHKDHNMMVPILEGVRTINSYGMEVVSGIIMGLDTDKPDTGDALLGFVEDSQIPLLTINLLQALPKTPLWDRLEREGRLVNDDDGRDSNVEFLLPYDQVVKFLAQMHGSRLPAGEAVRALPVPMRLHLFAADQGAGVARAEELGQHQARPDHAPEHLLESRRARRLPKSVLEVRARPAPSRRYRGPDRPGADRTSPDHVRACRVGRSAERVELFDPAARGLGPCRVANHENAGAAVPPLEDLRELTPARVGLGRAGASMTTDALLAFTLDHARARDAVHTAFDIPRLVAGLAGLGLQASPGFQPGAATGATICAVPISDACSIRIRGACWQSRAAARASLRS